MSLLLAMSRLLHRSSSRDERRTLLLFEVVLVLLLELLSKASAHSSACKPKPTGACIDSFVNLELKAGRTACSIECAHSV